MSVATLHPEYTADRQLEWKLMRHAFEGESAIKRQGEIYLPKPVGWGGMSDGGKAMYDAYIRRARFPEITASAIRGMVGVLHSQDWQVDIPPGLEYLHERATKDGLPLEVFMKRITTELLTTGRYAVLAEAPEGEGGDPYLAGYTAESLINWDELQNFYVVQETVNRRDGFKWSQVVQARALELIDGRYVQRVYEDNELVSEIAPIARGGRTIDFVPIAIGGAMDMDLKPDTPPLIGVARAALAHYQIYADYRLAMFMAYQATMVVKNATEVPRAVGAGVVISLESSEIGKDADAYYIAPPPEPIAAHERGMDREQQAATRSGAQMFDNTPKGQESGEARRLRFSAETANLQSVAGSSAAIAEKALRNAARMAGIDAVDDIIVKPPQNLLEGRLDGQEIASLVSAWEKGAFGYETLYENLQRGRIASMERDASDEQALIDRALPDLSNDGMV
jgi:hypothetical protein